jgi:starch phosphorylase
VQVVFAGKAHPRDDAGKELIRRIVDEARRPELRRRLVFLEDYDMALARYLVQGCDLWLNTPLRPLEASGTSGMKAMANGALNVSTLDGWWDEAWALSEKQGQSVGWAIGAGENYADTNYQDQVEAEALYALLERDIVPTFYDRRADKLPRRWIERMKSSLKTLAPLYNMHRMVRQYTEEYYLMAHVRYQHLSADNGAHARALAAWTCRVRENWPQVRVEAIDHSLSEVSLHSRMTVRAHVRLGALRPDDVLVELYMGRLDANGEICDAVPIAMQPAPAPAGDPWLFEARMEPRLRSGRHGYTVRVLPFHRDLVTPYLPGLITWAPEDVNQVEEA